MITRNIWKKNKAGDKSQVLFDLNIIHADYLLTRNVGDYQPAPMEVVQPVELLAILKV